MAMSNADCISRLEEILSQQESIEDFILRDDEPDMEDLREIERDIEAIKRAIRALERVSKQKKPQKGEC